MGYIFRSYVCVQRNYVLFNENYYNINICKEFLFKMLCQMYFYYMYNMMERYV